MDKTTIVLPSARAIRHEQLHIESETLLLPKHITMNEFISKLCIVENFRTVDNDTRVLLLLEASDFKEFSELQIQRNFFTFTKNSSYIFKFFEELSAELYDINALDLADTYGEYEEHIEILKKLYSNYKNICYKRGILDKIFLPQLYRFNETYAKSHSEILLHVDGHLTNFEFELLEKCADFSKLHIAFQTSKFNLKMQSKFADFGIDLEVDHSYIISLNEKRVLEKTHLQQTLKIECESFSESLLQISFIKQKVYEFIQKGYRAEAIAVVLPNESMAKLLKIFDEKGNFNFAMGDSFSSSDIYKKLNATKLLIEQNSQENSARFERMGDQFYQLLSKAYMLVSKEFDFISFLEEYKEQIVSKRELKIYEEEIYSFSKIIHIMQEMSVKSLLSVFLSRLASRSIDDVRGGKVTVMGLLETRSVSFDAVVIVDFDDKSVPKRSDKDMFLNSTIRESASLPTMSDRENLQKHYYKMLLIHSKEVAISFVNSSESSESRFLKQLGIKAKSCYSELAYADILFTKEVPKIYEPDEIRASYSFKDVKLSSTRLKTYLTCKRKYYYKYVKHIQGHEIPKDMPHEYEIGNAVHLALKELYSKKSSFNDLSELRSKLSRELDNAKGKSELDLYLIAIQKKLLEKFVEQEIERFAEGWEVAYTEKSLSVEYAGMNLVGTIDRIDKRDNFIEVLDYKTGSYSLYNDKNYTQATDFQLEFYYLLASEFGNVSCAFYDLKNSKIVPESFLEEKLEILKAHIKDLLSVEELTFSRCEDIKSCSYCEYAILCGRE